MSFDFSAENSSRSTRESILTRTSSNIIEKRKNIWNFTKQKLANAQDTQKEHAERRWTPSFEYKLDDMMSLFIEIIKIERSCKKWNHKWIESLKIKKFLKSAYQLDLSQSMRIHDCFYTFLLRWIATHSLIDQIQSPLFSIVANEEEEYEVNDILDNRYHYKKLQYRVVWIDHSSDRAWYSAENFEDSKNILAVYHHRYSEKRKLELWLIVMIEAMLSQWIRSQHREAKRLMLNEMKAKMKEKQFRKRLENSDLFSVDLKSLTTTDIDQ
jgi:hypothetical protein